MNDDLYRQINLPTVDISEQTERHVFVGRGTETEWNGHPSTVLMPDGKTIFCVWQARRDGSRQHGAPVGYMKRIATSCSTIPGRWTRAIAIWHIAGI